MRRGCGGWLSWNALPLGLAALLVASTSARVGWADDSGGELQILPPLELAYEAEVVPSEELPTGDPIIPSEPIVPAEPDVPFDGEEITAEPIDGKIVSLGEPLLEEPTVDGAAPQGVYSTPLQPTMLRTPLGYNTADNGPEWIIGDDDRFGMVSFGPSAIMPAGEGSSVVGGFGFHFLDGPVTTDMPPRLFDFLVGFQRRKWVTENVGYDFVARVGVFTDFEGSARKGVRFPGHAVVQFRNSPTREWLLGVDVLDRDDISLLPVFGMRWQAFDELRLDLVFPRPSVAVRLSDEVHWAYLRGELGGNTWAIERVDLTSDNATYRDLRLVLGIECRDDPNFGTALELGYLFGRDLSYRSGNGDMELKDAVMLSFGGTY